MSDCTKAELIRRNVFLTQELKNLKIENERLKKRGLWGSVVELFRKTEKLKIKNTGGK